MVGMSWCQNSTWHGIPDLYNSESRKAKIFWLFSLSLTSVIASWQVGRLLVAFFSGSNYSTSETIENRGRLAFPNVTVCNYNRANKSRIPLINFDEKSLELFLTAVEEPFPIQVSDEKSTNFTELYRDLIARLNGSYQYRKTMEFLGHDCEVSLLGCWWGSLSFNCCDYVNVISNVYGKCYSLNPPNIDNSTVLEQTTPGWGAGLTLLMDPGLEYYSDSILNNFYADGMVILINDVPNSFDVTGGISLQPGKYHDVIITAESSKYSDPDVPLFPMPCSKELKLEFYPGQYSPLLCADDCFLSLYRRYCGCIPDALGSTLNYTTCGIAALECLSNFSGNMQVFVELDLCAKRCGERCEYTMNYKPTVFQTNLSKTKMLRLKPKFNWPGNIDNYIYADIRYDSLGKVVKVTSEKTSFFDLISNIGGQLSLWCGMSFISFVQIIFYSCNCGCGNKTKIGSLAHGVANINTAASS